MTVDIAAKFSTDIMKLREELIFRYLPYSAFGKDVRFRMSAIISPDEETYFFDGLPYLRTSHPKLDYNLNTNKLTWRLDILPLH